MTLPFCRYKEGTHGNRIAETLYATCAQHNDVHQGAMRMHCQSLISMRIDKYVAPALLQRGHKSAC